MTVGMKGIEQKEERAVRGEAKPTTKRKEDEERTPCQTEKMLTDKIVSPYAPLRYSIPEPLKKRTRKNTLVKRGLPKS